MEFLPIGGVTLIKLHVPALDDVGEDGALGLDLLAHGGGPR